MLANSIWIPAALGGLLVGAILCAVIIMRIMPSMMIVTKECVHGLEDTVAKLEKAVKDHGWQIQGITHLNKSLEKHGVPFKPQVKILKICKPEYAQDVLTTDRHVSCLMPCSMAIWEGDDGKVYFSEMNVGLMGKLFGGNIARVMGNHVAREEHSMLKGLLK